MAKLLTVQQVAQRCGVSKRTVWRWVEEEKLPVLRTPTGRIRVDELALVELLRKQDRFDS